MLLHWPRARATHRREKEAGRKSLAAIWTLQSFGFGASGIGCGRPGHRSGTGPLAQNHMDHPGRLAVGLCRGIHRAHKSAVEDEQRIMSEPQPDADVAKEAKFLSGAYQRILRNTLSLSILATLGASIFFGWRCG